MRRYEILLTSLSLKMKLHKIRVPFGQNRIIRYIVNIIPPAVGGESSKSERGLLLFLLLSEAGMQEPPAFLSSQGVPRVEEGLCFAGCRIPRPQMAEAVPAQRPIA